MARVFKNMRSRMIEDGLIKTGIAPPVHQPQPFSVGVFSGELRWFPRVCADSCKRLRTSLVCHPTHLSAYSPLSGPFFSPASLPIKRPKSASTTNSPVPDQQVTSGWIAALATWTDRQKRPHRRNLDQTCPPAGLVQSSPTRRNRGQVISRTRSGSPHKGDRASASADTGSSPCAAT